MIKEDDIAISVRGLQKKFFLNEEYGNLFKRLFKRNVKEINAIDNIDFRVRRGEKVAILGKNGAGKTTLIKILSGILTQTQGSVCVEGFHPNKERYRYSYHIGVVLGQKSLLWYNIPVIESLKLYKEIYEITNEQFNNRLELFDNIFDIKKLLNTPVRKLSLGQRMKCEIVAALLHNPEILFLDEPTIGLDVLSKQQIYELLEKVNDIFKTTIILTTHNISDVERLCDRVILIDKGKMLFDDAKEKLLELDTQKTIVVKGNIVFDDDASQYIVESNEEIEEYILRCEKKQVSEVMKKLKEIPEGSDIEIKGASLETILAKIYKGDIIIENNKETF